MPWGVEEKKQKKTGEDEVTGKKTGGGIVDLEESKNEGVGEIKKSMEVASEKEPKGGHWRRKKGQAW
jgi:hypothetical protein